MTDIEQKAREAAYKAAWDAGYEGRETSAWDDFNTLDVPMGDPDDAQVVVDHKRSIDAAINAYRDILTVPKEGKKVSFSKGCDELAKGADHIGYGIHVTTAGKEWGNKIVVYGDEQLRDVILAFLSHRDSLTVPEEVEKVAERVRKWTGYFGPTITPNDAELAHLASAADDAADLLHHQAARIAEMNAENKRLSGEWLKLQNIRLGSEDFKRAETATAERDALKALVVKMRTELIEARREFLFDLPEDGVHRCSIDVTLSLTPTDLADRVVVPKEPTEAMIKAVHAAGIYLNMADEGWRLAWRAMLKEASRG